MENEISKTGVKIERPRHQRRSHLQTKHKRKKRIGKLTVNNAIAQARANTRTVLSTLWIFVLLNLFAKDLHEMGRPGMLQQIMTGVVNGVTITEELMLLGGVMFEIPILMVLLSQILPYAINRRLNIGAAAITIMIEIYSNLNPDLDNIFFLVIKILALLGVIWVAWRWRATE